MSPQLLLQKSELHLHNHPHFIPEVKMFSIFSKGAQWMFDRLQELNPEPALEWNSSLNYEYYGYLKYGICTACFIGSACFFFHHSFWLVPLSILIFYGLEVHFLFLFPLLIDGVNHPVHRSFMLTYKIGILKAMYTVMVVAAYMLWGLNDVKQPFRKWHIGCMAILLWYSEERKKLSVR